MRRKISKFFIDKVFRYNADAHLLIVDDNSPDKTGSEVKELQKNFQTSFSKADLRRKD